MHQSFDWKEIGDNINREENESTARMHLSEALHAYISVVLAEASNGSLVSPIHSAFACLTMCQYACAGKSDERCISHLIKKDGAVRVLQGAVTLGRLLNVERNYQC